MELFYEMPIEVPDILHNDFHVAYKYFTHQKIANVPWINELGRILYKQKMSAFAKRQWSFFWVCILYQSILPSIKNKKHLQNIECMYIKEL